MNPTRESVAIVLFLGLAVWLRLPGLFHDLPFSYYGDELHFVKRSMALGTGDLNPHWFHKPALLMYLLLFCFGMLFLGGRVTGAWASTEEFGAHFLADQGAFLLVARLLVFAFGMGAVWFGSRIARRVAGPVGGIAAGGFLALLPAMVGASQVVKADIPSAFFVAAASWAYLRGSADRTRPLVLAGILAGASMGTKYYGIIVVPGIVLAELLEVVGRRMSVGRFVRRGVLLAAVFVATFFVTSPYNFLDPLWRETIQRKIGRMVSLPPLPVGTAHAVETAQAAETAHAVEAASAEEVHFDPDSGVEFKPGLGAAPGALLHFGEELVDRRALGWGFLLLILLGLAPFARDGPGRRTLAVLGTPALIFTFFAVTIMAYHVNPRQLTAVFPLLGAFLWPGARLATSIVRRPGTAATWLAVGLLLAAAVVPLQRTLHVNRGLMLDDSRTTAFHWIVENVPPEDRVLLDDYGPIVPPSPAAVARLSERLAEFPPGEAFTQHEATRFDLLTRYPPEHGRDVELLGHPWWVARETPDAELRASERHRDMGNPLVDRTPRPVASYESEGFDWIVTNSEAQHRYFDSDAAGEAFPSFRSFYETLRAREPYHVIDPAAWGGNGPVVTVYRLSED